MITVEKLCKSYGKLTVLHGMDLQMGKGEITAVLGHNGCGKTTLIKCLLGLVHADSGKMTINGQMINGDPGYRSFIGYMPQIARYPENLSVQEVSTLIKNLRQEKDYDTFLWDRFRLDQELDKPVRALSGGTRQKLSAALAFMFKPRILILDEPTAGLDPLASGILKKQISRYRQQGASILLTSHVMSDIEELADKLIYMNDGKVVYNGELTAMIKKTGEKHLERAVARLMSGELS